jgi:hypothetical protein
MWLEGNTAEVSEGFLSDLIELSDWLELDGHQVDFNVFHFDDKASLSIEVYVDETFVGIATHWDDIIRLYDNYFEERVDN